MKRWLLLFSLLITAAGLLPAAALASEPEVEAEALDFADYLPEMVDYTLPNGLRVILAQDDSAPVVAVNIWYHVGGANDPENRSGFAHLFEHMMFEGSDNIGNDQFFALLEEIGAQNNAYTANDKTAYWAVAPAHELPRVLWMESDRLASLNVTEEAFVTQREVVIEEYNQRVANAPYGVSNRRLFTLPMQGYAPYERAVIGSVEDLEAATLDEVRAFHDKYYQPNNATLTIVGDIDMDETVALVAAYFGDIPAGEPLPPITAQYPLPEEFPTLRTNDAGCAIGYEETRIDPQVELPRYAGVTVAPPRGNTDFYALDLLTDILSDGDSSRYEQNIIRSGEAATVFTGLVDYLGGSLIYTIGYPNSGDSPDEVQALIQRELESIIDEGVTEAELERVKTQTLVNSITSFRESVRSTSEWLQDAVLTFDDPTAMVDEMEMYQAVTPADIRQAAESYFCEQPLNILVTLPDGEEELAESPGPLVEPVEIEADEPEAANLPLTTEEISDTLAALPAAVVSRTETPASLPVADSALPPFETFTLDNGLEVIYVARDEVPVLNLWLYVGGGDAAVSAEQQGLVDFMADLLTKGTTSRTAQEIAEAIESVGGATQSSASLEWSSLGVTGALSTDTDLAFDLLADMAQNPIFPEEELEVSRQQTLTFLEQEEVDPDTLANRQFGRIAYGDHPYGFYTTPDSVTDISREDMVEFHQTYYRPNNALLVVVGDISAAEAEAQVERVFGDWEAGDVPDYLDYPAAEVGDTDVIYLIDRPESEQATIQVGNRAINARNPDRYNLAVVNAVLGSGASSRLFENLREDKGYTYGVYSRFGRPNDTSTFRVLTDVDQAHAADAITEILAELEAIRNEPISAEELEDAKGLIIGSFALSIEDTADFARQLSIRRLTGVPIAELNDYLSNIDQVTAAAAQEAATEYINADDPIIVVVGNSEIVAPQLAALGEVVVVDKDGEVRD